MRSTRARVEADWLTAGNAEVLAKRIREYYSGKPEYSRVPIVVRVEQVTLVSGHSLHVIRSNLGGLLTPPEKGK